MSQMACSHVQIKLHALVISCAWLAVCIYAHCALNELH